jgi:hypothetical protein
VMTATSAWMLCQQTQQFDTGVTRAADDTDLDHNACPYQRAHWKAHDNRGRRL